MRLKDKAIRYLCIALIEGHELLTMVGIGRSPGVAQLGRLFHVPRLRFEPDVCYQRRILDTWWGRCNGVDAPMERPVDRRWN